MKVLTVHNRYYIGGGDDRVAWETAKILEKKGHQVIPFAMTSNKNWKTEYSSYFVDEIDYSRVKLSLRNSKTAIKMIYSLESQKKIERLIKANHPDIAHLHNIYGRLTPSILRSLKKFKIPAVMTLHDYKLICPSYSMTYNGKVCERCKGGKYYKSVITKCHRNSHIASFLYCIETYIHKLMEIYEKNIDFFITPSRFMMNKMIDFGMPAKKFVHIPNFIELNLYNPAFKTSDYFLYLGRLSHEKGILTLIKSTKNLKSAQLFIAGDGNLKKYLEVFVKEKKIKNVKFLGYLSGEKLTVTIRHADFVVLPSECYENCPMTILESFAYGKPVIGARMGGIPELIDDGINGLVFESGNSEDLAKKIKYFLNNSKKVIEMGKNARKKVEKKFNSDLYYQRLMDIYEKTIKKKKQNYLKS